MYAYHVYFGFKCNYIFPWTNTRSKPKLKKRIRPNIWILIRNSDLLKSVEDLRVPRHVCGQDQDDHVLGQKELHIYCYVQEVLTNFSTLLYVMGQDFFRN